MGGQSAHCLAVFRTLSVGGHPRDDVEDVHPGADERDSEESGEVDWFVERDHADGGDADNADRRPRPVNESNREVFQNETDEIERDPVPDDDTDTGKRSGEATGEVQRGRPEQFCEDCGP